MAWPISGPGIMRITQLARSKAFSLIIARGFYHWGRNSVTVPPLRLNGERWISVGRGVYLGAGCWLNASMPNTMTGPAITIGDRCSFAGDCVISAVSSVIIGPEVLLARNVYIADHDHAYSDTSRSILHQGVASVGKVVIDEGAWLGQNVVVTSGVRIGRGAVVGANSVVTRDVPDYSLAVGAPAKVVKSWHPTTSLQEC
jgi:acetyltransferase-like isoleucine patch superfamily enzyme